MMHTLGRFTIQKSSRKHWRIWDSEIIGKFRIIIGNKGYDSEENHIIAKKYCLLAIIPARKKDVLTHRTKVENKKKMKRHLSEKYNKRPIVETVNLRIKRKSKSFVKLETLGEFEKENIMKIIGYNIRRILVLNDSQVIFILEVFYRYSSKNFI